MIIGIGMPISQSRMPRIGAFPLFVDLRTNSGQNAESKSRFLDMGARMLRLFGASCFPDRCFTRNTRSNCKLRKSDGKALPNRFVF